jgi:prepilin-type N-terminal cleavage/methylation domain-containing protein
VVNLQHNSTRRAAFTLIELLAVVAIIGMLSVATIASYQSIANDVRSAGAVEQVKAALARGRGRAIASGRSTLVAFRPVFTSPGVQQIEIVLAQFAGNTYDWISDGSGSLPQGANLRLARFLPISGENPELLSSGVGVAATAHRFSDVEGDEQLAGSGDAQYLTTSNLLGVQGIPEAPGIIPAVLFGRDGSVAAIIQEAEAEWCFIDFNGDGAQRYDGSDYCNYTRQTGFNTPAPCPPELPDSVMEGTAPAGSCWLGAFYNPNGTFFQNRNLIEEAVPMCQWHDDDEPFVVITPYLAVFDDRDAREELDQGAWINTRQGAAYRGRDLTKFIDETGRVLHFNRYTGVALEASSR